MAAECHACARGSVSPLPVTLGNLHEPLGACQICCAFACGHHGERDARKPRFVCVECIPPALTQSAVSAGDFSSVQDFRSRHAAFEPIVTRAQGRTLDLQTPWRDEALRSIARNLPDERKELLVLAGTILQELFGDDVSLLPYLLDLRERVVKKQPWQ